MRTSVGVLALISLALVSCERRDDRPSTPNTDYQQALLSTGDEYETDSDRVLIQTIRQNLYNDSTLKNPNRKMIIISEHGTITLKGLVDTPYEKNTIENTIREINGVNEIYNQLEINGRDATLAENMLDLDIQEDEAFSGINDNELIQRINDILRRDPAIARSTLSINVLSFDGDVTLRGIVDTEQARNTIINRVKQIPGVNSVENQIQVRSNEASVKRQNNTRFARETDNFNNRNQNFANSDQELEQRIRIVLRNDPNLSAPAQSITIRVNDGFVTISGWANTEQERLAIGNRIRQLSGVNRVDNQIKAK